MQTFLTNARVIDGSGAPALENATVVIDGSAINYVGAAADAPQPTHADRVIDLGGKTVVPGLFNVHVHLALRLPFTERRIDQFTVGYRTMLVYRRALEAISTGTTTIRCVGEAHFTDIDVRNAINKGVIAGPRILSAGAAMIPTGGHGHNSMSCRETDGEAGFRQLAREQLRAGADLLKICLTGGIGTQGEKPADKQMTDDEVAAVVEVAHAAHKIVASHTGGNNPIKDCVRLGVDCIEHGYQFDEEAAQMMAEAGTYLVPTLCVTQELDYMRRHGVQEWMLSKAKAAADEHLASIRRAVKAGVHIGNGTDLLPSDPVDGTVATIREVEILTETGLSALEAIRAATSNSAKICGIEKTVGTLAPGYQADLLVIDGKPDHRDIDTSSDSPLARAKLLTDRGLIGRSGSELWIAWKTRMVDANRVGDHAGVSLMFGDQRMMQEPLFVGYSGGKRTLSVASNVGSRTVNLELDSNPDTFAVDSIPLDGQTHQWVMQIIFGERGDKVAVWCDVPPDQIHTARPHAETVNVNLVFDRLRLGVSRDASAWLFDDIVMATSIDAITEVQELQAANADR